MTLSIARRSRPWWMTPFGQEPMGDVFFDRLWPEWRRDYGEELTPSVDLSEKDGKYYLTAELPGMKKEDISISIENGYVTVSGKKEDNRVENGSDYYIREMRHGSFRRSFCLEKEVDDEKVDATYKDGVLSVVIPHREAAEKRKITVQ